MSIYLITVYNHPKKNRYKLLRQGEPTQELRHYIKIINM